MEERLEILKNVDEIDALLENFTDSFYTLSNGIVNRRDISRKLANSGTVFKLNNDIETIAFAAFYCNNYESFEAYLSMIAVASKYKKQGYGSRLLHNVIKYSKDAGMKSLKLEVRKENKEAIMFYKYMGFTVLDERKECYVLVKTM